MDRKIYRNTITKGSLEIFNVVVKETDLLIHASRSLVSETSELVLQYRGYIESFIRKNPSFAASMVPWHTNSLCPRIILDMVKAGKDANVGPMAAVAGAISQFVGQDLLLLSDEVIVENGGDIFIKTNDPVTVGIFAGKSPLSLKIGVKIDSTALPKAICTSSGTIGHSLSYGKADAVAVLADSCPLADAAATSIGNQIMGFRQIQDAVKFGRKIPGVQGIVIIIGKEMGIWGAVEIVSL